MNIWELSLSTIIGMLSSYLVWYLIYRILTPIINISDKISKKKSVDSKSGFNYRIKFENIGFRDIIDINIYAKLTIIDLLNKNEKRRDVTYLGTSFDGFIPFLKPINNFKKYFNKMILCIEENNEIENDSEFNDSKPIRSIVRIYSNSKSQEFFREYYPEIIRNKAEDQTLSLEDIMALGSNSFLEIIITGYDSFSSSKKVFIKKYSINDIVDKRFEFGSINIKN